MREKATVMDYLVVTYVIYTAAALALTGVLARTLFRHGKVFLASVFEGHDGLAEAVNHLLVVGFYMLQLGYAFMIFRTDNAFDAVEATRMLINNLGILLLSLGLIHFVNVFVFWKMRNRKPEAPTFPPVNPTAAVQPPPPAGAPYRASRAAG